MNISSLSTEYVKVPITETVNGVPANPTSFVVQMAFILDTSPATLPASGDWKTASWETAVTTYYARCLVGPGGTITLTAGKAYQVWIKISASPETPVRATGLLVVQ